MFFFLSRHATYKLISLWLSLATVVLLGANTLITLMRKAGSNHSGYEGLSPDTPTLQK